MSKLAGCTTRCNQHQVAHKRAPGVSRTQSVAGGHRASALYTVRRVPLVAPLPASPALPSRVQLSSTEMGVLTVQQMFAYMQAHLALPQHQQGAVGDAGGSFLANDAASTSYAWAGPAGAPHQLQSYLAVDEHGGIHAHPSDVNTLAGVNATKPIAPLAARVVGRRRRLLWYNGLCC